MAPSLILVVSPILHPIAARPHDLLAWYPATGIAVLRARRGVWRVVRVLPFDNAGALGGLLADELIVPFSDEDAAALSLALRAQPARPASAGMAEAR